MESKAKILGHPIHPMLVGFPVAFYASTLVAYSVYGATGDTFAFRVGVVANLAGIGAAALAAIPGLVDWAFAIPSAHPAKSIGLEHMLLNVGALALFATDAFLQLPRWSAAAPPALVPIALAALGVGMTLAAGYLGWTMVARYRVSLDDDTPRSKRTLGRKEATP